jgi:hypothetical protein
MRVRMRSTKWHAAAVIAVTRIGILSSRRRRNRKSAARVTRSHAWMSIARLPILSMPARCPAPGVTTSMAARTMLKRDDERNLFRMSRRQARAVPMGARAGCRRLHDVSFAPRFDSSRHAQGAWPHALPELSLRGGSSVARASRRVGVARRTTIAVRARPELPELSLAGARVQSSLRLETHAVRCAMSASSSAIRTSLHCCSSQRVRARRMFRRPTHPSGNASCPFAKGHEAKYDVGGAYVSDDSGRFGNDRLRRSGRLCRCERFGAV